MPEENSGPTLTEAVVESLCRKSLRARFNFPDELTVHAGVWQHDDQVTIWESVVETNGNLREFSCKVVGSPDRNFVTLTVS